MAISTPETATSRCWCQLWQFGWLNFYSIWGPFVTTAGTKDRGSPFWCEDGKTSWSLLPWNAADQTLLADSPGVYRQLVFANPFSKPTFDFCPQPAHSSDTALQSPKKKFPTQEMVHLKKPRCTQSTPRGRGHYQVEVTLNGGVYSCGCYPRWYASLTKTTRCHKCAA